MVTTDNQASLCFSLRESVWFQKGQEVAEVLSISLDPDIVIEEEDYEVSVKGNLLLTGEYIPEESETPSFSLRELSPVRTLENVYTREDGVNEIFHFFPLEISIPRQRVEQIEDLYVTIESFDYEMPEKGCLQLLADISIYGLVDEVRDEEVEEEEFEEVVDEEDDYEYEEEPELYHIPIAGQLEVEREEGIEEIEEVEEEPEEEEIFEPFHLEIRKTPVLEEPEEKQEEFIPHFDRITQTKSVQQKQNVVEEELEEEEEFIPHFDRITQTKPVQQKQKSVEEEPEEEEEFIPHFNRYTQTKPVRQEQNSAEEEKEEAPSYSHRDENALYLTKLFAKDREEEFTKMRLYFVQAGDTIDSIADKYGVNVQHLSRVNGLDDLYVSEGKVLFIPISKKAQ
ncbi:stage VI sporulation protein D [Microbacteriaceae bacterium 4G12]